MPTSVFRPVRAGGHRHILDSMSRGWAKGSDSRWRTFRAGILARDRGLCQVRGRRCLDIATQVDHIQPLALGGEKYDPGNCRAACAPCNLDRRVTLTAAVSTPHSRW